MKFRDRLYVSTIASDAASLAAEYGLGLELAQFCIAENLDDESGCLPEVAAQMRCARRFVLHGPYCELSPASIDPLALALTRQRYLQAARMAANLGVFRIVIHTGYIPYVYEPCWMVERSVAFWKALLPELPQDTVVLLENVMEDGPAIQRDILAAVNDRRLRACLDLGHANAACSKTPAADWIPALAPWLSHVHIHNNFGDRDLHLPLGEGDLPMEVLLRQLEATCPDVTYTIETMEAASSVDFLRTRGFLEQP